MAGASSSGTRRAGSTRADRAADPEIAEKLRRATVDVGAVIDFASSFGTLVLTRAYADWSAPVNADYRGQLVSRAVDLVQLFPAAAYAKNGADIRLAVDAVEDMFRLPDLTHVVIVAGDSDYIALAQRCRRLGRYVVGVGVAGSTSRAARRGMRRTRDVRRASGHHACRRLPAARRTQRLGGRPNMRSLAARRRAEVTAGQAASGRGDRTMPSPRARRPAGGGDQAAGTGTAARPGKG